MTTKIPMLFMLMSEQKITQKQLSDNIGVSEGNISDWKSGRAVPGTEALMKISQFFDCSIDYLLGRTENPKSHKCISITTGDIKDNNNSVIGNGNSDISITVQASGQAAALLEVFEKLDPFKQAKVLLFVEELNKTE